MRLAMRAQHVKANGSRDRGQRQRDKPVETVTFLLFSLLVFQLHPLHRTDQPEHYTLTLHGQCLKAGAPSPVGVGPRPPQLLEALAGRS